MIATIWHNPACGTSRTVLALLQGQTGLEVKIVEYLRDPPTIAELKALYAVAGITPAQGLRLRGTDAEQRGLDRAGDDTVLAAMAAEPRLIERPLVRTEKGVRVCRPAEQVLELL